MSNADHRPHVADSQATEILRNSGLLPASTAVSAKIDLANLVYSKRRTRTGTTPSTQDSDKVRPDKDNDGSGNM